MSRGRAYLRHQAHRVKHTRIREVKMTYSAEDFNRLEARGALHSLENRHFFGCNCSNCKWNKWNGVTKHKYQENRGDREAHEALLFWS